MTYVEFFDKTASENITACLSYAPERVIFIGDNPDVMDRHVKRYTQVFAERDQTIEFVVKTASKSNLDHAVALLSWVVETYEDCVFDITGGAEILNLALGIVYNRYPDKNIQIHRFNLRNNEIFDCDKDGNTIYRETPELSIAENLCIYGGAVNKGNEKEEKTSKWDWTADFQKDVQLLWEVCKKHKRRWNVQCEIFEAMEKVGKISEDGLTVVAKKAAVESRLSKKHKKVQTILDYLCDHDLLKNYDDSDEKNITLTYKDLQVKKCLITAGQVLELKVFLIARGICGKDGKPIYQDAINGVVIDWDGEFHDEETEGIYDTENEIDVLLMHGVVPVFISCKNGDVTSDELYKLNTVAERFGGQYAKKVLIATALTQLGDKGEYVRQRAKDMRIRVIDNFQTMDDGKMAKKLANLWKN